MYRKLASALLVASAINAKYAFALGLGGITMHSALNQPLDAEIALSNVAGLDKSQIMVTLASPEDFQKAGVDRTFFLSDIKFDVTLDGKGGGVVKLRSQKRLNEPYLDFLIEAKWPTGRMLRSYTALVDLPVYADEQASQVEAVSAQPVSAPSAPAVEPAPSRQVAPSAAPVVPASVPASKPVAKPAAPKAQIQPKPRAVESSYTGEGYKIQPNQTLSKIASELRPAGDVSVNQTMLAIQKLNPHAFIRNNVNLIKAGAVLRIPTAADVRQMTAAAASREIERQTLEWRGAQLDATDASRAPVAGAPAPEAEEARLSLTSAGSGLASGKDKAGAGAIGSSQGTAAKDGVDAATLKKELDAKRENLKRMIEVKDAELAALQKNLGKDAAGAAEAAKKAAEAEAKEPAAVEAAPAQTAPAPESEVAKEPAASQPAAQPKREPKKPQPKKAAPAPEEAAEPGILDMIKANALYIGLVALVLMFGVVAVIFRRKAQADRQAMAENDIENFDFDKGIDFESAAAAEAHEIADEVESHAVEEVAGADELVADEQSTVVQTSDPIGEAEIYIAYGRYDQAADLLSNAIAANPENVEFRSKLLEVYLEARNKAGFQQQFIALRGLGQAAAISHAKELLTSVDGVSDWLDDLPADEGVVSSAAEAEEDEFASLLSDVDLAEDDIDLAGAESGLSDFSFDELESPLKPDPEEEDVALDLSDDFSFAGEAAEEEVADLSLDFETAESDLASELDASFVTAPVTEAADAELDLGDLSFDLPEDFGAEPVAEEALPELEPVSVEESLALDDFDFGLKEEAAPEEAAPESEELSLEGFDLDLGLGEPAPEPEEAESAGLAEAVVEDTLDFSDVDLGLDVGLASVEAEPSGAEAGLGEDTLAESPISEAEFEFGDLAEMPDMAEPEPVEAEAPAYQSVAEEAPAAAPAVAEVSAQPQEAHVSAPIATLESEDLEFLTDGDEVSTKLDLAQAYVDLGDIDGARDILLEVMKEGRDEQKAEAAALLDSLD